MTRSNAIDFSRERFALLALFNEKGNETTLETINYILEFWLLFHNNFVFRFMLWFVVIKKLLELEKSSRLESRERHAMQANDLAKR